MGEWTSIRSTHSLAFQEVENSTSKIVIEQLEIKNKNVIKLLQKYNLHFLGFTNASIKQDYSILYNDDKNYISLKNWHEFETKYPDIFQGMYQFWVKKG